MPLSRERLRLQLDTRRRTPALDVITAETPVVWRGTDLQIELGIFEDGTLADITLLDQIVIEVKATEDRAGTVLLRATVDYADLERTLTQEEWDAGALAHAVAEIPAAETALELNGEDTRNFHLVVSALTTESPARSLVLGTTTLTMEEDGAGGPYTSPEPAEDYWTADEADARFVKLSDYTDVSTDVLILEETVDELGGRVFDVEASDTAQLSTLGEHADELDAHDTRLDALEAATSTVTAPGFNGIVRALLLDGDTLYAAGDFTTVAGLATAGVARLTVQGQVDGRFVGLRGFAGSQTNWAPTRLALAPDGDLLVAANKFLGKLDGVTGEPRHSGTSPSWATPSTRPGILTGSTWSAVAAARVAGDDYVFALAHNLAYTLADGGADANYAAAGSTSISGLAPVRNADGLWRLALAHTAYVSAGVPETFDGYTAPRALRLVLPSDPDSGDLPWGSDADHRDDAFTAGAGAGSKASCGAVIAGYDVTDGAYLIAGNILGDDDVDHSWDGGSTTQFRGLLKVWLDGTADPDFTINLVLTADEGAAIPFAVDGQQRLYFGGPVESINGTAVTPWRLYRVTKDGDFDAEFDGFDDAVLCCVLRDDDTLIVGGEFATYGARTANRIAFLDASGQMITPAMQGATAGKVWDYAALPDVRNVPALARGLVCVTADPPTLHRWNATAEEWTAL